MCYYFLINGDQTAWTLTSPQIGEAMVLVKCCSFFEFYCMAILLVTCCVGNYNTALLVCSSTHSMCRESRQKN